MHIHLFKIRVCYMYVHDIVYVDMFMYMCVMYMYVHYNILEECSALWASEREGVIIT